MEISATVHFASGSQLDVVIEADSVEAAQAWWGENLTNMGAATVFRGLNPRRAVVLNLSSVAYVDGFERIRSEVKPLV